MAVAASLVVSAADKFRYLLGGAEVVAKIEDPPRQLRRSFEISVMGSPGDGQGPKTVSAGGDLWGIGGTIETAPLRRVKGAGLGALARSV